MAVAVAGTLGAGALTADFIEIEPPSFAESFYGADINDAEQVAGSYWNNGQHAFLRDADGGYSELTHPAGFPDRTWALALNAAGDVVGSASDDANSLSTAVLWPASADPPVDLGALPGHVKSYAKDINDAGVIVGESAATTSGPWSAWVREPEAGLLVDLGLLPDAYGAHVSAINDHGVIVGWTDQPGRNLGFLWTKTDGMQAMPLPPQASSFHPLDINNSGQVIGQTAKFNWLWDPALGYSKLAKVGDDPGTPAAINDDGLIVGWVGGYIGELDIDIYRPVAWDPSTHEATEFAHFPGTTSGRLVAVNDNGLALGTSADREVFVGQIEPDPAPVAPPAAPPATAVDAKPRFTG